MKKILKPRILPGIDSRFIMTQWSIDQQDITVLHAYIPNNISPIYMKQKLIDMQTEIDKSTIIIIYFNIPLQQSIEQVGMKITKAIYLNSTINHLT